jgi:tight adherence protein C
MSRALVCAVAAAALASWGVVELATARREQLRTASRSKPGALLIAALVRIGRRAGVPAAPGDVAARLAAAGAPRSLGLGDVMAIKGAAALVALVAGTPVAAALPGRLPLFAGVIFPVGAFLTPDVWLARRVRMRGRAMERELPDLLDLLRVALEAGLPLWGALGECARHDAGLLARELRVTAAELELGLSRERVLDGLAARCPAPGMPALVSVLGRAARYGAPPGEALGALAREARAAHARRVREDAARAAPKIQLVVALLLVPSVMLLVAAALLRSLL